MCTTHFICGYIAGTAVRVMTAAVAHVSSCHSSSFLLSPFEFPDVFSSLGRMLSVASIDFVLETGSSRVTCYRHGAVRPAPTTAPSIPECSRRKHFYIRPRPKTNEATTHTTNMRGRSSPATTGMMPDCPPVSTPHCSGHSFPAVKLA
jgi:hypothetical protein